MLNSTNLILVLMGKLKLHFLPAFLLVFLVHGLLKGDLMTSLLFDVITFSTYIFDLFGMLVFDMAVLFIYVSQMLLIWLVWFNLSRTDQHSNNSELKSSVWPLAFSTKD